MSIYLPTTLPIPSTIILVDRDPQFIFAQLLKFGREHSLPTHYLGDLYHDAIWLKEYHAALLVDGYFYFGLRTHGTSIGQDFSLIDRYSDHTALCILPTVSRTSIRDVCHDARALRVLSKNGAPVVVRRER